MLVEAMADLAAKRDVSLVRDVARSNASKHIVNSPLLYRTASGAYVRGLYTFVPFNTQYAFAVVDMLAALPFIDLVSMSIESWASKTVSNSRTGRDWRPGEVALDEGASSVQRILLTAAANREGRSHAVVTALAADGTDTGGDVLKDLRERATTFAQQLADMVMKASTLSGDVGRLSPRAELLSELAVPDSLRVRYGVAFERSGSLTTALFAVPGTPRHQAARDLVGRSSVSDPRREAERER